MARKTRITVGSIVVALVVLAGAAPVAGPALAQETTEDGTTGTDAMGNESMADDGIGTETMGDDSMTEGDTMTGDGTMTDEETDDQSGGTGMDDETASGGQPGFGAVVGLLALVASAAFVLHRRRG